MQQFIGMQPELHSEIAKLVPVSNDHCLIYGRWHLTAVDPIVDRIEVDGTGMYLLHRINKCWQFAATGLANYP